MAKTLSSQCRGPGFDPGVREADSPAPTKDLACHNDAGKILHAATKTWRSQISILRKRNKKHQKLGRQTAAYGGSQNFWGTCSWFWKG